MKYEKGVIEKWLLFCNSDGFIKILYANDIAYYKNKVKIITKILRKLLDKSFLWRYYVFG